MEATIVMRSDKISANILISTSAEQPDIAIVKIPCNEQVDQTLMFIAEKAVELEQTDNIRIKGYRHDNVNLLTAEVKIAEKIYGSLSVTLIPKEDASLEIHEGQEPKGTPQGLDKSIQRDAVERT